MCGPHRRFAPLLSRTLRRIPQAVSTVATLVVAQLGQDLGRYVSIPQAVSTVATWLCVYDIAEAYAVSIPQAVSTVATLQNKKENTAISSTVSIPQAVSTVATLLKI